MPLFKTWSEDKLNKKFVVAENFAELVSKGKRFCFPWRVGDLTLFEALTSGAFDRLNWQHSGEFDPNFSKKSNAPGFAGGMGGFGIDWYINNSLSNTSDKFRGWLETLKFNTVKFDILDLGKHKRLTKIHY